MDSKVAGPRSLRIFRFGTLSRPELRHGITGRAVALPAEGDFSFVTGPDEATVLANRRAWCAEIGISADWLICARQVHGTRVDVVDTADVGRGAHSIEQAVAGADGFVTTAIGVPLAVLSADCVPILMYDPVRHAIGAAHAGWRGTVAGIGLKLVETMVEAFGSDPADLLVGLGPSIGPCCYVVGPEVIAAWNDLGLDPAGTAVRRDADQFIFDLWQANRIGLITAGVDDDHIELAGICTSCNADTYFSRRAGRGHRGLFASIIALDDQG